MIKFTVENTIVVIVFMALISIISFKSGYNAGVDKGVCIALDSVNFKLNEHMKSDTSVTKLIIVNPDTTVYILSKKTLLK